MKSKILVAVAVIAAMVATNGCKRGKQAVMEQMPMVELSVYESYTPQLSCLRIDGREFSNAALQLVDTPVAVADTAEIAGRIRAIGLPDNVGLYWDVYGGSCTLKLYDREPVMAERLRPLDFLAVDHSTLGQVTFRFSDAGGWERVTGNNIGRCLLLAVNGKIVCSPVVVNTISGGMTSVTGEDAVLRELFPGVDIDAIIK